MTKEATEVLSKLPKNTPTWAVGLAVILVSASVALATVYVLAKDDVGKLVSSNVAVKEKIQISESNTLSQVLALATSNGEAIARLSEDNGSLKARVSALEQELVKTKTSLAACEESLKFCREKR